MQQWTKVKTMRALGFLNICRVVLYRFKKKLGYFSKETVELPKGNFFYDLDIISSGLESNLNWHQEIRYFDHLPLMLTNLPPDWHVNPITGARLDPSLPWWKVEDFDVKQGDIKCFWQASRMDWALTFAQAAKQGDLEAFNKLNVWLSNWVEHNPPYFGVNWKCGQETAIRIMHLAMAALILEQAESPSEVLLAFIACHLKRIKSTFSYALAQDNNHATSEAAALFIGGSWLVSQGDISGEKYYQLGRKKLEQLTKRLVEPDGSFSQYSINYHRLLLDTFSMVEVWRTYWKLAPFSAAWQSRVTSAVNFLAMIVDPKTGDAPNLGANDGARLLPLTDTNYRDYRPCVQLAMVLFQDKRAYLEEGSWDLPLKWLRIAFKKPEKEALKRACLFDDGGYAILRRPKVMVLMRYPRFRFRPSHADALHLDLWIDGENYLRDGGTYSYQVNTEDLNYFSGVSSHNTVEFDGRDQMPRLGRFLFGDWLEALGLDDLNETEEVTSFGASYQDSYGATHSRKIELNDLSLKVHDEIKGFVSRAVLRWRLKPGHWQIKDHSLYQGHQQIHVIASVPILRFELVEGMESRFYLHKNTLPVLEIEVSQPGKLTTEYHWSL